MCADGTCDPCTDQERDYWLKRFNAAPMPVIIDVEQMRADRVYDHSPYKYADA